MRSRKIQIHESHVEIIRINHMMEYSVSSSWDNGSVMCPSVIGGLKYINYLRDSYKELAAEVCRLDLFPHSKKDNRLFA